MKISANGIAFNCAVDGPEGAPWLVFSHSLGANLTMWDAQMPVVASDYRVLRCDTRGHGGTDVPGGAYSLDMLVGDVVGLFDHFDIERAHFVGLSLGGMTALGLAINYSGRVNSVTVCDAMASMPTGMDAVWDERIATAERNIEELVEPTIERWFTEGFRARDPDEIERVRNMIRATAPAGYAGCCHAIKDLDYMPRLGEITTPTLFLTGSTDAGAPPEAVRDAHEKVAGARYVELDPGAHITNIERPDAFNQALTGFLAG